VDTFVFFDPPAVADRGVVRRLPVGLRADVDASDLIEQLTAGPLRGDADASSEVIGVQGQDRLPPSAREDTPAGTYGDHAACHRGRELPEDGRRLLVER